MKILFINGCLEPKKDGVGDYIRRLGTACQKQSHQISAISIKDSWIKTEKSIQTQDSFPILRINNAIENRIDKKAFYQYVERYQPDVISLQFVCYSFHPKGLCFQLYPLLKAIPKKISRHIMAHELWIGPHDQAPLKEKCIGWLQKQCIKPILKQGHLIHTHSPIYQKLLATLSIPSQILPLFPNIPIAQGDPKATLYALLKTQVPSLSEKDYQSTLIFSFFGSIYRNFKSELIWQFLETVKSHYQKNIIILSLGHLGASKSDWENFKKQAPSHFNCLSFDNIDDKTLSLCLQAIDFGFATTPQSLIEKSGSAAVLKAHGIPTILCRNDVTFHAIKNGNPTPENGFIPLASDLSHTLLKHQKTTPHDTVDAIAKRFINNIQDALHSR